MKPIYLLVEHLCGNVEQTRHIEYFEALEDAKAHARALFRREGTECTFREVTPYTQYGKTRAYLQVIPGNRDTRKFRSLWIPNRIELHYIKPTNPNETNK